MRKINRTVALCFIALIGGYGMLVNAADDVGTVEEGVLKVAIDLTYPPYDMLVDDEPAGFDPEFVSELADQIGIKLEIIDTRWAVILPGLRGRRYDMIASALYISAERDKIIDFVPYFQTGNSIIMRQGSEQRYVVPQDLCGIQVGMITATVGGKILTGSESKKCEDNGKDPVQLKEYPTDAEATQALLSGQVQAQMTDAAVATYIANKFNDRLEITSDRIIYPVAVGIGIRKDADALKAAIEDAFDRMKASGFYSRLLEKYGLEPVDPEVLAQSYE